MKYGEVFDWEIEIKIDLLVKGKEFDVDAAVRFVNGRRVPIHLTKVPRFLILNVLLFDISTFPFQLRIAFVIMVTS